MTDRKKDMMIVSGFNVFPNEVESVISSMPGVIECAVAGVPHEIMGEVVTAFVVRQNESVTAEQIIAYCRRHLTNYKTPKVVEFRAELPKNTIGKVLRRELRTGASAGGSVPRAAAERT